MAESNYSVSRETFGREEVYVLRDGLGGREARVLPSVGNNCIAFQARMRGKVINLIYSPPNPETLQERPSGYGIPILFPWPNRIDEGRFVFGGEEYRLDSPTLGSHVSHGFVLNRPWEVISSGASDAEGAWVKSSFLALDFPDVIRQFPFPFKLEGTYRLKDGVLELELEVLNKGMGVMPVGFGMHPYFPLPLRKDSNRDLCKVQIPAETYWLLRDDMIPTGEILPVSEEFDLRKPTPLKGRFYDNIWSNVIMREGWSRCLYIDESYCPISEVKLVVEADSIFRELVLYAPEKRPVISFEPYTCVTNAFNLDAQGIDAGLIRLESGGRLVGKMRIFAEIE